MGEINKKSVGALVVAAGKGSRMGLGFNKVLALLDGRPVLKWSVDTLIQSGLVGSLVLVVNPQEEDAVREICVEYAGNFPIGFVHGGKERQDSVARGLSALPKETEIVLIHDGARPFVSEDILKRSIESAWAHGAACAAVPAKDTVKIADESLCIEDTPDRSRVWLAQTPQSFRMELIRKVYEKALSEGLAGTDDAGLAELCGHKVHLFEGSYSNIKLTSPEDLLIAGLLAGKK